MIPYSRCFAGCYVSGNPSAIDLTIFRRGTLIFLNHSALCIARFLFSLYPVENTTIIHIDSENIPVYSDSAIGT